jgi:hypothetical protein
MRRFVLGWKMLGLERSLGSRIVTYARDFERTSEKIGASLYRRGAETVSRRAATGDATLTNLTAGGGAPKKA